MHGLIPFIAAAVHHHPATALLVAFAAAVLEAVVIIGALVPGTAVMMTVAGMASVAGLPKLPFVLVGAAGAVVGDTFSYWVGRRYGGHLRGVWPFSRHPALLIRAELYFARFGAPSVVAGRFILGLRAAIPLVAGMAGMTVRSFLTADILAALMWAPLHILPAQFAGVAIDRVRAGDWRAVAAIGAALLVVAAGFYAMHRLIRRQTAMADAAARPAPCRSQSAVSRSRRDAAAG